MLERLKEFNRLSAAFNQARSLPTLSDAILACLKQMNGCARGGVWLRPYRSNEPVLMGSFGYDDGSSPMPQVHNAYNLLCAPLCYRESILGFIQAEAHDSTSFDELSQELFATLANQAAVALENARLFADVQETYVETISSLANALEARDNYTKGHSERVTQYSMAIAQVINLESERLQILKHAAMLHDIGKIGIKDIILNKNGRLTQDERATIERHSVLGDLILGPCTFLAGVQKIVLHHHERYDGLGYPEGLSGENIPLEARIIAVADSFDAMTSDRPYRQALSLKHAIEELQKGAGTQFDPALVEAFLSWLSTHHLLTHIAGKASEAA